MNGNDWMDVVTVVLEQHEAAEYSLREVAEASPDARADRFRSLTLLLSEHEAAEENVVYPALRKLGPAGTALADVLATEEAAAKAALKSLGTMEPTSPEFAERFADLMGAVLQHADNERASVLPLLQTSFTDQERRAMGDAFLAAQHHRPTE